MENKELEAIMVSIMEGKKMIAVGENYYFLNDLINRKSGTKVECSVVAMDEFKKDRSITNEDLLAVEELLQQMATIRILDYSITKEVKANLASLRIKMTIGLQLPNQDQAKLFDSINTLEKTLKENNAAITITTNEGITSAIGEMPVVERPERDQFEKDEE